MKKIVILGCENSHASQFLSYIKENPKYSDVEVVGVYSDEADSMTKLEEKFDVKKMESYDSLVGQVDGVIVTARHGDNHLKYAKPYIESGVPMFIDKPVTIKEDEAIEFMKLLKKHGNKITGGSCIKYVDEVRKLKKDHNENINGKTIGGIVRTPVSLVNNYGGFYFYSGHLVETEGEIFGRFPESVFVKNNNSNLTVTINHRDFSTIGLFVTDNYNYSVGRIALDDETYYKFPITGDSECFKTEFDEYYKVLKGGEMEYTLEELFAPVFVLNAIDRSIKSEKEEKVNSFKFND